MYKISFCTVCMNRLQHLKQTLQANIDDNIDYPELEFILLDYSSTDGLEDYIREHMTEYISNGRLIFYQAMSHQYFNRSHSRNLAFRLATGDIICNIDADNFTGKGFASYINNEFNKANNIFLSVFASKSTLIRNDMFGRICMRKTDFHAVTGYDERMINYGYEDHDLVNRLEAAGITSVAIADNPEFYKVITHPPDLRIENEYLINSLKYALVNYLTPASSDIILLFDNGTYKRGTVIETAKFRHITPISEIYKAQQSYEYAITEKDWAEGMWTGDEHQLTLLDSDGWEFNLFLNNENFCYSPIDFSIRFFRIKDNNLIRQLTMFCSQITNRIILWINKLSDIYAVNKAYGSDTVVKNFDRSQLIQIR